MTTQTRRGTSAIVSIATIIVAVSLIGCKQGILVLEDSRWAVRRHQEPNFVLYVMSHSSKPVDIEIKMDGMAAVHETIQTRVRHGHWSPNKFLFFVSKGQHKLEIESLITQAKLEREFEIENRLWCIITYGISGFSIDFRKSPILFM